MGSLFKAAKAKVAADDTKSKSKGTSWTVSTADANEAKDLGEAISEMVEISTKIKSLNTKMDVHKNRLKRFCDQQFVGHVASVGIMPDTPMKLVNEENGRSITYVVQERSSKVSDEQFADVVGVLGEDGASDVIYEATTFGFDPVILAKEGVLEALEDALSAAFDKLVADHKMTEGEKNEILTAETVKTFRPGMHARLSQICGKDKTRIAELLDAMGSCSVRYVKP